MLTLRGKLFVSMMTLITLLLPLHGFPSVRRQRDDPVDHRKMASSSDGSIVCWRGHIQRAF
jgi:hypothetical protein